MREVSKSDLRSGVGKEDKCSEVQYHANLTAFLSIRYLKNKQYHMPTQSVTHAPELIFNHVVRGQHMTSELLTRLSVAKILCSCRKDCLPTVIYTLILKGHINLSDAVQTYASERQSTYTTKQSLH